MQFSFACHFNFINSISKRSALDTRKPRERLGAKAQYFLLHIIFWKISHSSLNSFSINFDLTKTKL